MTTHHYICFAGVIVTAPVESRSASPFTSHLAGRLDNRRQLDLTATVGVHVNWLRFDGLNVWPEEADSTVAWIPPALTFGLCSEGRNQ